jgi:hypothetical protein
MAIDSASMDRIRIRMRSRLIKNKPKYRTPCEAVNAAMKRLTCVCVAFAAATGCSGKSLEQSFFEKRPHDRVERLRRYSLEEQYRIFRYGNDRIGPPIMELAKPLAERGDTAIPFLYAQLRRAADDQTLRDILLVFETMTRLRTYDLSRMVR